MSSADGAGLKLKPTCHDHQNTVWLKEAEEPGVCVLLPMSPSPSDTQRVAVQLSGMVGPALHSGLEAPTSSITQGLWNLHLHLQERKWRSRSQGSSGGAGCLRVSLL